MIKISIKGLIEVFSKLPNLGPSSSRRLVLHLLRNKEKTMIPLSQYIIALAEQIVSCQFCGNFDVISPCNICQDKKRNQKSLCVVEDLGDLWAFERGGIYSGLYHVLGGTLSAIDGVGPESLNLDGLRDRITLNGVEEVIIATNATLDGQVTAHYITELIKGSGAKVSRLACGIPIGGEIDYLDEGTLKAALVSRHEVES